MIAITKSMIALSALLSAGLVAAAGGLASRSAEPAANVAVAQRFPLPSEMFVPASTINSGTEAIERTAAKGSRLDVMGPCDPQGWPFLSEQCLSSGDGSAAGKMDRVITIHRGLGPNASELVRVPVADMAQR